MKRDLLLFSTLIFYCVMKSKRDPEPGEIIQGILLVNSFLI